MRAIFLADAHLRRRSDTGYRKLERFLSLLAEGYLPGSASGMSGPTPDKSGIDALIIAGDFFDFWFGRDQRIYPEFQPMVERLVALKDRGITLHLCEGNHDFFLERYFAETLGIALYAGESVLDMDGLKLLVSHGDTVDQTNTRYLLLRRFLRSRPVYLLQACLPPVVLWKMALLSSSLSRGLTEEAQDRITVIMNEYALEKFNAGFDAVILGHCHKPLLKEYTMGGRRKVFATLGDWLQHFSYLYYDNGRFCLHYFQ